MSEKRELNVKELDQVSGGFIRFRPPGSRRKKDVTQDILKYESHKCSFETKNNDYVMAR